MRRAPCLAAGAFGLVTAVAAHHAAAADGSGMSGTGPAPSFASLPEGHVPLLPDTEAPRRIAASEKVPGFTVSGSPSDRLGGRRPRQNAIFVSAGDDGAGPSATTPTEVCLVDGGDAVSLARRGGGDDAAPADWPSGVMTSVAFASHTQTLHVNRAKKGVVNMDADVHVVRSERFVAGHGGGAFLEIADAWVDARTRGGRLIERSTLPMSRVFVGPNGLELYAARDGEALEVVVHLPDHPSGDAAVDSRLRARMQEMAVFLPDHTSAGTQCGHLRFVLRPYAGAGQMATIQALAFLPPLDGDSAPPPEGEAESDDARGAREQGAMRARPYQLTLSATASGADKDPAVSIAIGWTGREVPSN